MLISGGLNTVLCVFCRPEPNTEYGIAFFALVLFQNLQITTKGNGVNGDFHGEDARTTQLGFGFLPVFIETLSFIG